MKTGIIGATGRAGSSILSEALQNVFDTTKAVIKDFNIIVHPFGVWKNEIHLHVEAIEHLLSLLYNSNTRLIVVCGDGCLFVDKEKKIKLMDLYDYLNSLNNELHINKDNVSQISYKDFAVAVLDMIESGKNIGEHRSALAHNKY